MTGKDDFLITLTGVRQAREGYTFLFEGPSPRCEDCDYYLVCIKSLEVGRVYTVVGLRENVFPCALHDAGVRVVEVTKSDIWTTLPSKLAIGGAIITFQAQDCDVQTCESFDKCVPRGLLRGDRCRILEIGETVPCSKGLSLRRVVLRWVPPAS